MRRKTFEKLMVVLLGMNVYDAVMTSFWLTAGLMTETNPIMAAAWEISPLVFMAAKLALVAVAILAFLYAWQSEYKTTVIWSSSTVSLLYAAVCVGHTVWFVMYVIAPFIGMEVTA